MVRSQTIYPTTGYAPAPPFVADPMSMQNFTIQFLQWNEKTGSYEDVVITIGIPWDDNVYNSGGISHGLVTYLSTLWQSLVIQAMLRPIVDGESRQQFALKSGSNLCQMDGAVVAYLHMVQPPPQIDYWYKSDDFAKYGWLAAFDPNLNKQQQHWWNFHDQIISIDNLFTAGVEVFMIGPDAIGVLELWAGKNIPEIVFSGAFGFSGTYDYKGLHT
jgi:hypothetical protein